MAEIHVLDKHTAELIAAGEVVERPASVVKELVENAIDAHATQITVSMQRGGIALLQIADNGSGIDAEYIPTAFLRHATSKISKEDDLEHIATLGFRGEALASICSVAKVELLTKTPQDEFASLYRIEGGEEQGLEAAARGNGTTITVRDLFYNTPARMKFLKKDVSEGNTVAETVTRLALSHPEISFTLVRDGKNLFTTPGDGSLQGAAYAVLTRDFARDLVAVQYEEDAFRVQGLVTPPKSARASRAMQYFYVNGRFVKNRTMMAALESAYRGMMMQGKYPGCVLFLTMPAQKVDVNVHPAKTEVRFANEKEIFEVVYKAVRGVLMTPQNTEKELRFAAGEKTEEAPFAPQGSETPAAFAQAAPTAGGSAPVAPAAPAYSGTAAAAAPYVPSAATAQHIEDMPKNTAASGAAVPYKLNGASPDIPYMEDAEIKAADEVLQRVLQAARRQAQEAPATGSATQPAGSAMQATPATAQAPAAVQESFLPVEEDGKEALRYVGEVFNTYIIAQRGQDICFIDKHAAHERSIFEKLSAVHGAADAQMLLAPVSVQLSAEEKNAVLENAELLQQNGLEVEDFGVGEVILRSVPSDVVPQDAADLLVELAQRLCNHQRDTLDEKTQWVMHSISCRAAIKGGDKTNAAHLIHLAQQVLDGEIPPFCPHGRPCVLKLTKKELEKQFGRLG